MLRTEKTESPALRPPELMVSGADRSFSGAVSAVLMGTFLRARPACGPRGRDDVGGDGRVAGPVRPGDTVWGRGLDQPTVMASIAACASELSSSEIGAEPAASAAACWPSEETM